MSKASTLKSYSVLLLIPDYAAHDFGQDTYYDFVRAKTVKTAVVRARNRVMKEYNIDNPDDLFVLLVTEGHHQALA
jgi:hypothetical protein